MIETLSPFPREAAPRIWVWAEKLLGKLFDDGIPRDEEGFIGYWLEVIDKQPTWGVMIGEDLVGIISAAPMQGTMRISSVFKPSAWGKADEALRAVYEELFEAGEDQVQAVVFSFNQAMISLLHRLGAVGAADFQKAAMLNGRPKKLILMVTTKEKYYALSTRGSCGLIGGERNLIGAEQPLAQTEADLPDRQHAHV